MAKSLSMNNGSSILTTANSRIAWTIKYFLPILLFRSVAFFSAVGSDLAVVQFKAVGKASLLVNKYYSGNCVAYYIVFGENLASNASRKIPLPTILPSTNMLAECIKLSQPFTTNKI